MRFETKCECGRAMVGGAIACSTCYAEARERSAHNKVVLDGHPWNRGDLEKSVSRVRAVLCGDADTVAESDLGQRKFLLEWLARAEKSLLGLGGELGAEWRKSIDNEPCKE